MLLLCLLSGILVSCASSQKKLAEQQEKDPQYQYEKAVVCMQYGMADEAIKYLNVSLALDPRHLLSHNLLGLAHMIKGNLPEAIKAFESCLGINPQFSEAHNNLGTALQESGQIDKSEEEFKKAYAIDGNYNASYNLAKLYYGQNKLDQAREYIQKSLQKYNRSLLAWNLQGLIHEGGGKFDEAIASYEQALKIVPNEVNVSFNLGVAYYKSERYERAKEILEKILPNVKNEDLKAKIQEVLKRIDKR
jgi:tetratricopeptide (TPR) repeat protein